MSSGPAPPGGGQPPKQPVALPMQPKSSSNSRTRAGVALGTFHALTSAVPTTTPQSHPAAEPATPEEQTGTFGHTNGAGQSSGGLQVDDPVGMPAADQNNAAPQGKAAGPANAPSQEDIADPATTTDEGTTTDEAPLADEAPPADEVPPSGVAAPADEAVLSNAAAPVEEPAQATTEVQVGPSGEDTVGQPNHAPNQSVAPGPATAPGQPDGSAPAAAPTAAVAQPAQPIQPLQIVGVPAQAATFPPVRPLQQPQHAQHAQNQQLFRGTGMMVTNHFQILTGAVPDLYEYALNIIQVNPAPAANHGIPQRVRRRVVYLLINHLHNTLNLPRPASDYHSVLITVVPIDPNANAVHTVTYYDDWEAGPGPNPMQFDVTLQNPIRLSLNQMRQYLTNPTHPNYIQHGVDVFIPTRDRVLRALNIIFSNRANLKTFKDRVLGLDQVTSRIGSKRFYVLHAPGTPDAQGGQLGPWNIDQSMYALPGYFLSARAPISVAGNIFLNVNTTTSAFFRPQNLNVLIQQLLGHNSLFNVQNFIRGIRVVTNYMNTSSIHQGNGPRAEMAHTISGFPSLHPHPTAGNVNTTVQGAVQTVQAYFAATHTHHNLVVNPNDLVVSAGRTVIPARLLDIVVGSPVKQETEMVQHAARLPNINVNMISTNGKAIFDIATPGPAATNPLNTANLFSGITINQNMAQVTARLLHAPRIGYRRRQAPFNPLAVGQNNLQLGRWNLMNCRYQVVDHPNAAGSMWTFVQLTRPDINNGPNRPPTRQSSTHQALRTWFDTVRQELGNYGITSQGFAFPNENFDRHQMQISNQRTDQAVAADEAALAQRIQNFRRSMPAGRRMDLIFVLLPQREVPLYAMVKRVGDQNTGMRTICHVNRPRGNTTGPNTNQNFIGNLSMKFNLKINPQGANQTFAQFGNVPILDNDTMLMGADVTHPGVGSMGGAPSVAALVGSIDSNFSQFPASLQENARGQPVPGTQFGNVSERIWNLHLMVEERIRHYRTRRQGRFPRQLVFYRDGLSEEQLDMCRIHELTEIQRGITLAKIGDNSIPNPRILLICTIKRHNVRFFQDPNNQNRHLFFPTQNPLPGVLIDNTVTMGPNKDFFLYSHEALQGTAKPTHYAVLHNSNNENLTEIAAMTNSLCYIFQRATRSVSLAPPAYYADLAADRARHYVRHIYAPFPINQGVAWTAATHPMNLNVHQNLTNNMFYI